jgi:hypothetical protein
MKASGSAGVRYNAISFFITGSLAQGRTGHEPPHRIGPIDHGIVPGTGDCHRIGIERAQPCDPDHRIAVAARQPHRAGGGADEIGHRRRLDIERRHVDGGLPAALVRNDATRQQRRIVWLVLQPAEPGVIAAGIRFVGERPSATRGQPGKPLKFRAAPVYLHAERDHPRERRG